MALGHLRAGSLFFVVLGSAIAGLLFGSELVRWLIAAALAVVAVPFWVSAQRFLQKQFWRDVETVIAASDERRIAEQSSEQV